MSNEVVLALLSRVRTHGLKQQLTHFEFIFHGGEPLLVETDFYRRFVRQAHEILMPDIQPIFSLQTNGTLLTEEWCAVLGELNISLGISLDGTALVNDQFRVDHQGKGSYQAIVKGLKMAQASPHLRRSPGVLCVIDVTADPIEVYQHFQSLAIQQINFLLPYATHDIPPPGLIPGSQTTPYANWLISLFDQWFEDHSPKPQIKIFEQIIELILGIDRGSEYWGGKKLEFMVVETDGGIEAVGAFKVCGNRFTKAGMNVLYHELEEALETKLAHLYQLSHQHLPKQCSKCSVVKVCGGGFVPHRYRKSNGFDNPSVFCFDLFRLIAHIQNKILEILPKDLVTNANWEALALEDENYIKITH